MPNDPFSALFAQLSPIARAFFSGNLCTAAAFGDGVRSGHLHVMRSGGLTVTRTGKSDVTVREPSLLFVPRHAPHGFLPDMPAGADLACATVRIGGGEGNPVAQSLPELLIVPLAAMQGSGPTLELLLNEAFGEKAGRQVALDRLFEYLIVLILRHVVGVGLLGVGVLAGLGDLRLSRALTALHDAPARPWTLDMLADLAGMSRTRFAAHFRAVVGQTPMEYLTGWRMTMARNLLRDGMPVKSIATAVGYDSSAALSRVFTKIEGLSPRAWQDANRERRAEGA